MKRFIILFLLFCFALPAMAVSFDTSIDASIRKDYNIQEDLPALPNVVPTAVEEEIHSKAVNATGKTYTLKSGTKVLLNSQKAISDRMTRGTRVSFVSQNGFVTKEGAIIPTGTVFKGLITDSHPPQLSGNGGLIELCIDEIYFNGVMSKIETKLSMANSKRVFLSNIKGKRSYWKNYAKVTTPGRKVFGATQTAASAMSAIPVVNLLSFVPLVGGAVIYTVNVVTAPVIAVFTKGGNLTLPAGTLFEVKIKGPIQIQG